MRKYELVQASDCSELMSKLNAQSIKVIKPRKELTSRESAIEYLQLRLSQLAKFPVLATPVMLPSCPQYTEAVAELNRLGELLKDAVRPWARGRLETKMVEQAKLLRYMEEHSESKKLHWAVYRAEESNNGQSIPNRPQLQQASSERPHPRLHA